MQCFFSLKVNRFDKFCIVPFIEQDSAPYQHIHICYRLCYEVINHSKAYQYVKSCIVPGLTLAENIVKNIPTILLENIMVGGIYRNRVPPC